MPFVRRIHQRCDLLLRQASRCGRRRRLRSTPAPGVPAVPRSFPGQGSAGPARVCPLHPRQHPLPGALWRTLPAQTRPLPPARCHQSPARGGVETERRRSPSERQSAGLLGDARSSLHPRLLLLRAAGSRSWLGPLALRPSTPCCRAVEKGHTLCFASARVKSTGRLRTRHD